MTAASATCCRGIATSEFPRSAAGVVARQSAGEYDSKEVRDGIAYLRHYGQGFRPGAAIIISSTGSIMRPRRCGCEGGDAWTEWYTAIARRFARTRQSAAGYWADTGVCNEYGTAMALIILQIPNDYLPIFQR